MQELLSNKKEIGVYWLKNDSLSIDREILLHYVLSGCIIGSALKRILKRLSPDLPIHKGLGFKSLVSLPEWEILHSSPQIELHERVLAKAANKGKAKKKNKKKVENK